MQHAHHVGVVEISSILNRDHDGVVALTALAVVVDLEVECSLHIKRQYADNTKAQRGYTPR